MLSRHSNRSFQSRNLTTEHHAELMKVLRQYSQLDHQLGQQPVRFEYISAALKVWPVVGAHEFLVAIAPSEYNRLSIIDVGRSLQKIVLHATRLGLASCWIGPGADQSSIVEHLGDKFDSAKDHVICVCAIGYESIYKPLFIRFLRRLQHKRLPLSELFFCINMLNTPIDVESKPLSDFGRCYEACRWSPSSYNSQPTRCTAVIEPVNGQQKLTRFDFYCATASRYYAPVALGIWCANWETGCEALKRNGHFTVLSSEERTSDADSELPRYDISWIID